MANYLVEIDRKELPILQHLYKSNGTKSYIGYMTLNNYIRWFEQDPDVKHIKVFCLNGDFSDGTFVLTDRNRAYTDTLNESFERLSQLLQMIDYSKGFRFLGIRPEIRSILKTSLQQAKIMIASESKTILYYLRKDEAMKYKVELGDGIRLRPITELHDMEKASQMWISHDTNPFPYVKRLVKYNPNVAAFQDDGTLVSWILRLPIGLLGGLQTDEHHYGHGYGAMVTKQLSKEIAEMGDDVYAAIYPDNVPSKSLFKKLGFEPVGEIFFVATNINWSSADE